MLYIFTMLLPYIPTVNFVPCFDNETVKTLLPMPLMQIGFNVLAL